MMSKRVVLTGSPGNKWKKSKYNLTLSRFDLGVGKTTLIKKIVHRLKEMNKNIDGFYTEELRSNNSRIGFDVISLSGKRSRLARTQ